MCCLSVQRKEPIAFNCRLDRYISDAMSCGPLIDYHGVTEENQMRWTSGQSGTHDWPMGAAGSTVLQGANDAVLSFELRNCGINQQ